MKVGVSLVLLLVSLPLAAETTTYRVLFGGVDTGHLVVNRHANQIAIDYDFKQNGRGPTIAEEITLNEQGYPVDWMITGRLVFGSAVDEYFRVEDGVARWQDTTGQGEATINGATLFYIEQNASVYSRTLLVRALLAAPDRRLNVYPSGEASIRRRAMMSFDGPSGQIAATAYEILGLSMNPELVFVDQEGEFFATASPRFSIIREGYVAADELLREYSEALSTERFVEIQARAAHKFDAPVRIRDVRIFDPERLALHLGRRLARDRQQGDGSERDDGG